MKGLAGIEQPPSRRDFSSEPPKTQTEKKTYFPSIFFQKYQCIIEKKSHENLLRFSPKGNCFVFFLAKSLSLFSREK